MVVLYNPGSTLLDLHLVLSSQIYQLKMLEKVKDPIITQYWEKIFPKTAKNSFNIKDIMNQGKILLVNLSKGKIGEDNSSLLGSVLVGKILIAALSRAEIEQENRK